MKRPHSGIALILTLILTSLLLLLVGAFFALNQEQIRFRVADENEVRAQQAALSGLEYARMRLEVDPLWGIPGQGRQRNFQTEGLTIFENDRFLANSDELFLSVGLLADGESHFQISLLEAGAIAEERSQGRFSDAAIAGRRQGPMETWERAALQAQDHSINYLMAMPWSPALSPADGASALRAVSPGQCRLIVRGYCRGRSVLADATLALQEITGASLSSGGSMDIDPDIENQFGRVQPGRWLVATMQEGKNSVESTGAMTLRGLGPDSPAQTFVGSNGTASAADRIQVDRQAIRRVVASSDGRLEVGREGAAEDIRTGPAALVSGGQYKPNEGVSPLSNLSVTEAENVMDRSANHRVRLPGGEYRFTAENVLEGPAGTVRDTLEHDGEVVARIRDHKLIFSQGMSITFQGPTTIRADGGIRPGLLIGYENADVNYSWLPSNSTGTFLKVERGSLDIDGSIGGKGGLMATGNTTQQGDILMRGRSQMAADPDAPVTLFAERNIQVTPPDPSMADFFSVDLSPLASAIDRYARSNTVPPRRIGRRWYEGRDPWVDGDHPLQHFTGLGHGQDVLTQGGSNPVSDRLVSTRSIKTTPISTDPGRLKRALAEKFPLLSGPIGDPVSDQARANYDAMFSRLNEGGMTAGRYIRLREYLREMQRAENAGSPLPSPDPASPNASRWANLDRMNERVNDQLKAEISFFDKKGRTVGHPTLRNLVESQSNSDPRNNAFTREMNEMDAHWTGLMYARGSIAIESGFGNFDLRGAALSLFDLAIFKVHSVTSVYDPSYLRQLSEFRFRNRTGQKFMRTFFLFR